MEEGGNPETAIEMEGGELDEQLRKQCWYLGEVTEEVATSILLQAPRSNTFAVYRSQNVAAPYTLSARFHVEGVPEDIVEHLRLSRTNGGRFQLQGTAEECDDIISTVNNYVTGRDPPLAPAIGRSFTTQLSLPDDPPSYSQAERTLAPDIAPLPDVGSLRIETAKEAKTGRISPSASLGRHRGARNDGPTASTVAPDYISNSHWHRYNNHSILHPKNVLHCCCYRDTYWNGRRERYAHKWYSLRGTGPLRLLGLLLTL
jgi:hypothetical protein